VCVRACVRTCVDKYAVVFWF